jgi:choline dehydrogenase-like flavoprotein
MRAVGLSMVRGGKKEAVTARKEVILSAGAINTPQILMLSGIGPKTHLDSLKVDNARYIYTIIVHCFPRSHFV